MGCEFTQPEQNRIVTLCHSRKAIDLAANERLDAPRANTLLGLQNPGQCARRPRNKGGRAEARASREAHVKLNAAPCGQQ